MPTQTFEITEEESRIINVVKGVMDFKNVKDVVKFIIKAYAKSESYSEFIKKKRKKLKLK